MLTNHELEALRASLSQPGPVVAQVEKSGPIPCLRCGYDRRGVPAESRCPECGYRPPAGSARGSAVDVVDAEDLHRLRLYSALMSASLLWVFVYFCYAAPMDLLFTKPRWFELSSRCALALSLGVWSISVFRITAPFGAVFADRSQEGSGARSGRLLRNACRWTTVAPAIGMCVWLANSIRNLSGPINAPPLSAEAIWVLEMIRILSAFAGLAAWVLSCYLAAWFASWLSDDDLADSLRRLPLLAIGGYLAMGIVSIAGLPTATLMFTTLAILFIASLAATGIVAWRLIQFSSLARWAVINRQAALDRINSSSQRIQKRVADAQKRRIVVVPKVLPDLALEDAAPAVPRNAKFTPRAASGVTRRPHDQSGSTRAGDAPII